MTVQVKGSEYEVDRSNNPDITLMVVDGDPEAPYLTLKWGVYELDELIKSDCSEVNNPMFSYSYARETYMEQFCNDNFNDFIIV